MLSLLDRFSGWLTWVAAGLVAVMLVVGPQLGVAKDKDNPSASEAAGRSAYSTGGGGGQPDGAALFKSNCGSCHTLQKAGTSGQVGPPLDNPPGLADVEQRVRDGGGSMPAFGGKLSDAEIKAVARYVAGD